MEEEENGPDYTMGFKNKSIDKISGQVQQMSGVTGSVSKNAPKGVVSDIDKKYWSSMSKYMSDQSSGAFGGVKGFAVKQALNKGDYAGATAAMKELKKSNPAAFAKLDDYAKMQSGFSRGGRFSDKPGTYTGDVKKANSGYERTDKTFDPLSQTTSEKKYKFED